MNVMRNEENAKKRYAALNYAYLIYATQYGPFFLNKKIFFYKKNNIFDRNIYYRVFKKKMPRYIECINIMYDIILFIKQIVN